MSLEILTATLAAGETKSFMVNGQYIELIDGQYPVDVLMQGREGGVVGVLKGAEVSFFSRPKVPFGQVQITSAQAQVVRFFIGDGDAGTRRISSTVQVVDGGRQRVNAGIAFCVSGDQAAVNTKYAVVQLWNPIGSGRRLIVNSLGANSSAVSNVYFFAQNSASANGAASVGTVANKRAGGPVGAAQIRSDSMAAFGGAAYGAWVSLALPVAYSQAIWKPTEPIVVEPGWGIVAMCNAASASLAASFEWFEESIT